MIAYRDFQKHPIIKHYKDLTDFLHKNERSLDTHNKFMKRNNDISKTFSERNMSRFFEYKQDNGLFAKVCFHKDTSFHGAPSKYMNDAFKINEIDLDDDGKIDQLRFTTRLRIYENVSRAKCNVISTYNKNHNMFIYMASRDIEIGEQLYRHFGVIESLVILLFDSKIDIEIRKQLQHFIIDKCVHTQEMDYVFFSFLCHE